MSAYGKAQPSHQGYGHGRTYPESAFPYVPPPYQSQASVNAAVPAPAYQNGPQMSQMAYTSNHPRTPYEDQAGAYLNVGSGPVPEWTSTNPTSGSAGMPLYVYITSGYELNSPEFFLGVGQQKCRTHAVKVGQQGAVCQYRISTTVPEFASTGWQSSQVPLLMYMESRDGDMLAKLDVGNFAYTDGGSQGDRSISHEASRKRKLSTDSTEMMKSPAKRSSGHSALRPKEEYQTPGPYGYAPAEGQFSTPYLQPSHSYNSMVPQYNRTTAGYPSQPASRQVSYGYAGSATESPPTMKAQSPHVGSWSPAYSAGIGSNLSRSPGIPSNVGAARPGLTSVPSAAAATPQLIRTSTITQSSSPIPNAHGGHPFNPYAMYPNKAKLEIQGDLDSMLDEHWTKEEWDTKRRIVKFERLQSGSTITASFQAVSMEDKPVGILISCIYWAEKEACYVTSVDTIQLLEQLVAVRFTVEEKNRIRRNLEGFRPLTVSKGKPESEEFFKVIMAFPNPKPRNIEKDVKVFAWKDLSSALKKIIGKYSASPATTLPPGPSLLTPVSSTGYATEGSSAGISYTSDHHAAISPRSMAGSTTSTAYSSNLSARTMSPHAQKSMPLQHGSSDLRASVPHHAHEASSHWQGNQHHMPSQQHYHHLGSHSNRSSWDMSSSYLENSPAGTSAPQSNYSSSRNVADNASDIRSHAQLQSHQMPRT